MKLCVFQGTFNPIHRVHLRVAEFALKQYGFDKILFIPAFIPPHKSVDNSLAEHRFNMVKIATSDNPKLEVSDIEYKRGGNSYTYLTILELRKEYGIEDRINFLIGTDAFNKIDTWYEADKLKDLLHFIVYPRCKNFNIKDYDKFKDLGYDFEFSPMEYIDVSSTEVRDNIHCGKGIKELEIPRVMEYIKENGLYKVAEG